MDGSDVIVQDDLRSGRKSAPEVRGEVLSGPERRRRWSVEEKLRILAQSTAPGSAASAVCRMYGISTGQLYTWRKQFRTGELTGFAPVAILADVPAAPPADPVPVAEPMPTVPPERPVIEVELPSGIKLRVTGLVEEAALRRVLAALS